MHMKTLIIFCFLAISYPAFSETYYVAPATATPAGDDSNSGTIDEPWATFTKAISIAMPGDTVYFRGGTYFVDYHIQILPESSLGHNGTAIAPINYSNYENEIPIFDFASKMPEGSEIRGITLWRAKYIHFRGLVFRNIRQRFDNTSAIGFYALDCENLTFTNNVAHNIGGHGFKTHNGNNIHYLNCDAFNCCDTLNFINGPGNTAAGFSATSDNTTTGMSVYYDGCRAWNISDDGFDGNNEGLLQYDNCWAWRTGLKYFFDWPPPRWDGAKYSTGSGFKFGFEDTEHPVRIVRNCIAAYCAYIGFHDNASNKVKSEQYYYNNFSYKNGVWGYMAWNSLDVFGKVITYHNNIAFNNGSGSLYDMVECINSHNSWDTEGISVDDDSFLSLDTADLRLPRNLDGSLPDINFGKLSFNSNLINAGIDVGQKYMGNAPDIGAFETRQQEDGNFFPYISISAPKSGETFSAPGPIILKTSYSDPDGTVQSVEFFNDTTKIGEITPPEDSLIWNNASAGYSSLYAVATDNDGASTVSARIYIKIVPSEYTYNAKENILLYPNPNNGIFKIVLNSPLETNSVITITSSTGSIICSNIMTREELSKDFNLSLIKPGIYILSLAGDEIIETKKFIKQ